MRSHSSKEYRSVYENHAFHRTDMNRRFIKAYEEGRKISSGRTYSEVRSESEEVTKTKNDLRFLDTKIKNKFNQAQRASAEMKSMRQRRVYNPNKYARLKSEVETCTSEMNYHVNQYNETQAHLITLIGKDPEARKQLVNRLREVERTLKISEDKKFVPIFHSKGERRFGFKKKHSRLFGRVRYRTRSRYKTRGAHQAMHAYLTTAALAGVTEFKSVDGKKIKVTDLSERLEASAERAKVVYQHHPHFTDYLRSSYSDEVDEMLENDDYSKVKELSEKIGADLKGAKGYEKLVLNRDFEHVMNYKNRCDVEIGIKMFEEINAGMQNFLQKFKVPENSPFYAVCKNTEKTLETLKKNLAGGDAKEINASKGALLSNVDNLAPNLASVIGKARNILEQHRRLSDTVAFQEDIDHLKALEARVKAAIDVYQWDRSKDTEAVQREIRAIFNEFNDILEARSEGINPAYLSPLKRKQRMSGKDGLLLNHEKAAQALKELEEKMKPIQEERAAINQRMRENSATMKETTDEEQLAGLRKANKDLEDELKQLNRKPENRKIIDEYEALKEKVKAHGVTSGLGASAAAQATVAIAA